MLDFDEMKKKRLELLDAYGEIFGCEKGQKVLADLKTQCGLNALTIYGPDLIFNEGKRSIGKYIEYMLEEYGEELGNGNN